MSELRNPIKKASEVQPELDFFGRLNGHLDNGCPGWANDWQEAFQITDPVTLANLEDVRQKGNWCGRCVVRMPEYRAELAAAGFDLKELGL
jgi:hypothetical protein